MKASVTVEFGRIEYMDVDEPVIGDDEALIEVASSGVCGTDIHVFQGHHPAAKPPVIMGHEFSGIVRETGKVNKKNLKAGERVVVQPFYSCGVCELCITGRDNVCPDLKIFGIHVNGSFAEYTKAPIQRIYRIQDDLDFSTASLIEPLAVALHDVRSSGLRIGESVLVIGGGPIGLLIAAVARMNGAFPIAVSELNPHRKRFLSGMGFEVLDPRESDVLEAGRERTGGMGWDKVFEVSGTRSGTELMLQAVKTGGTAVIVGIPTDKYPMDTDMIFKREISIRGVRIHSQINFKDAVKLAGLPEMRKVLKGLITKEFPLSGLKDAVNLSLTSTEIEKLVINNSL